MLVAVFLPVWTPHNTVNVHSDVAPCHYDYQTKRYEDMQECKGAAGQETSQQEAAHQPQHTKAAGKKKQRGGKKAAAKGGKGTRTASGSVAQAADSDEEATVEFFVPADEKKADLVFTG